MNVQTKIGQKFLQSIKKCFPPSHPLSQVVNKNTVKLSYKCMPNMNRIISSHNQKVQKQEVNPGNPGCNCCPDSDPCPMAGGCQVKSLVYKATVTDQDNKVNTYTGLTSMTFKKRYQGHKHSFTHRNSDSSTTLSAHLWELKDQQKDFNLKWEVVDRAPPFNPVTRKCRLGLKEKFYILFKPEGATLNKR